LDWAKAAKHIKEIRDSPKAAKSFARLFARNGPESATVMLGRLERISHDLIRKTRVRLDCVAMLTYRHFFRTLASIGLAIYVWTDSSPQWKGTELYAASFDVCLPGFFQRRSFPYISPKVGHDTVAKGVALLWQIFLMAGPHFSQVRRFCQRVRCLVTDLGTERLLADHIDFLPDFYRYIGSTAPANKLTYETFLFPRAMVMAGWRHLWDNLLRRALASMTFFPAWIDKLKVTRS
jgi:hypothetical protein